MADAETVNVEMGDAEAADDETMNSETGDAEVAEWPMMRRLVLLPRGARPGGALLPKRRPPDRTLSVYFGARRLRPYSTKP